MRDITSPVMNSVCCLTRGYSEENIQKYDMLIRRNKSISTNLLDKSITIKIFHEGNISPKQQDFINKHTPELKVEYTNIKEYGCFTRVEEILTFPGFTMGYRHMCSFWFSEFLNVCLSDDLILRIDEDCVINFSIDDVFKRLNDKIAITGILANDSEAVCKDMNLHTLKFMKSIGKSGVKKNPSGPYTNVMGINIKKIRKSPLVLQYMKFIQDSKGIYNYRWGDLPLWGEIFKYILPNEQLVTDRQIKYYHGSHKKTVNG